MLIRRTMTPEELLPDSFVDTRPDAPGPMRQVTNRQALAHEEAASTLLSRLRHRPGGTYDAMGVELRKAIAEFRSWQLCPPTREVRDRVLERWTGLHAQAVSAIAGDR